MSQPTAPQEYERRRTEGLATDARLDSWSALYGHSRVVLLIIAIIAGVRAWRGDIGQPWTLHLVLGALFLGLFIAQGLIDARRARARRLAAFYARGLSRLAGGWTAFASRGDRFAHADHPYALDLDVVGKGSLFQLLDTTRTAQGEATLASWLLAPATVSALEERRATTRALINELDAREALALSGADDEIVHVDEAPLVAWGEGPPLFELPPWLRWVATILPLFSIASLTALRFGLLSPWTVLGLLSLHIVVIRLTRTGVPAVAQVAETTEKVLTRLLPILIAARAQPTTTPQLVRLRAALEGAVEATASLKRRVTLFQSRANLIVAVVAPLVFWDVHAARFLQAWQRTHGRSLRGWFAALGELEALSASATYAYEHPGDVWPQLVDGGRVFEGKAIGHPLLPSDRCVRNDVELAGPGTSLLVTGSNMSGKSTLLRAVGLNAVLALAGLPVRAAALKTSRLQVATAMRVSDSLQEGASFFLAEVKRLKRVVDLAHAQPPVLFLLDEILQGTNTRERSLGARGVVAHLLGAGAMGLVSTHDLSLAKLGDAVGERMTYAHFTDQVEGDRMTFDYKMRPGIVQTSNALRLMRAVGLQVDVPPEPVDALAAPAAR